MTIDRTSLKQILAALAACLMAVGIIYVIDHFIVHIGGTKSDRDMIVALEVAAVAVLIAFVIGKEIMELLENLLRAIRGQGPKHASVTDKIVLVYVTIIVSLGIYFAFMNFAIRP
jgi:hypothetical protein